MPWLHTQQKLPIRQVVHKKKLQGKKSSVYMFRGEQDASGWQRPSSNVCKLFVPTDKKKRYEQLKPFQPFTGHEQRKLVDCKLFEVHDSFCKRTVHRSKVVLQHCSVCCQISMALLMLAITSSKLPLPSYIMCLSSNHSSYTAVLM